MYLLRSLLFIVSCFVPHSQDDGSCNACPLVASAWDQYRGLLVIVGALAVIVVVVWIVLLLLVRLRGGTLTGGASRMASLGVWGFMTVQVFLIDYLSLPFTWMMLKRQSFM